MTVRGRATLELFRQVVDAMVEHPGFRRDMPSVWDLRASAGFGEFSRAELAQMVNLSRAARGPGASYRVAMVAGRDLDFGVGRMLGGGVAGAGGNPQVGVFRDLGEAEEWAFRSERS